MLNKTANQFTTTGELEHDFWLVNGIRDFAVLPDGVVQKFGALPIRLHVGTPSYGGVHIQKHMNKWPKYIERQGILMADILYQKLGQTGIIYSTESPNKCKIHLSLLPNALVILQYRFAGDDQYWSVTSFYPPHNANLDGVKLGRYPGVPGRNQVQR